jgi:hypothetical protein
MKKIIKWAVLIVLIIVIGGLLIVYFNLNHIIRTTVETQATASTNLKTTLGGVDLSLFGGKLNLSNLDVGSPKGFSAPEMMSLGGLDLAVNYSQLKSDPIHVADIKISNPKLVLEQVGGNFNVKAAMDQMPKSEPAPAPQPSGKREQGQPIRLIIDDLVLSGASVDLKPGDVPGIGKMKDYTLTLPAIELKQIGQGEGNQNGAAIKDVVMLVLSTMMSKAADSDQLPPELKALMKKDVSAVASQMEAKLGSEVAKKIGGDLGQTVGNVIKNPSAATSNPSQLLEQGLGAFGKKKLAAPTTKPAK